MGQTSHLEKIRDTLHSLWSSNAKLSGVKLSYKPNSGRNSIRHNLFVMKIFRVPGGSFEVICEDEHRLPHYVREKDIVSISVPGSIFKEDNPNATFIESKGRR